MCEFCDVFDFRNLITEPTCFKNPINPSSIDVILMNKFRSFQNSNVIEMGLSNHHKLVVTVMVMNSIVKKRAPVVIKYRDFKKYNASTFHAELCYALRQSKHSKINYGLFESTFMDKLIKANTGPFLNRVLSKAFMKSSRLRNKFLRNRSSCNKSLKRSNGIIVLTYEENQSVTNIKHFTDNKKFWKTVWPFCSEKHKQKYYTR